MTLTRAQRLARIQRLQVLYGLFATLHWCLGYRFLVVEKGFSVSEALVVPLVSYVASIVVILALPRIEWRQAMRFGFAFRILTIVPYLLWPTSLGIFVSSLFFGVAIVLFWVPYNVIYFEHRAATDKAEMSAHYAAIAPFVDVVATLAAGWLVVSYGYEALFGAAILGGIVPLIVSFRLRPQKAVPMEPWKRIGRLPRLRTIIVVQGISQGTMWPAVPLVTLVFIQGTYAYAGFFALLGLAGAVAAVLLGKFSDRTARRVLFLTPFALLFGVANAVSAAVGAVGAWGVWRGIASFSNTILDPFRNTVLLDHAGDIVDLQVGRELLLNLGRAVGVVALLAFVHFDALQWSLVIPGAIGIVTPILIEAKQLYPEESLVLKPFRAMFRQ